MTIIQCPTALALDDYTNACAMLAQVFTQKYYDITPPDIDFHWVGGRIGGVLCLGDEFWNIDRMREALELGATQDQLLTYYHAEVEAATNDKKLRTNFRNYVLHNMPLDQEGEKQ